MTFVCSKHPDRKAILISGRKYCEECSRSLEREQITEWAHHAKPELTREKTLRLLNELFGTPDWGFSTFPKLYSIIPREIKKDEFVLSQQSYIQKVFLKYIGDKHAVETLTPVVLGTE